MERPINSVERPFKSVVRPWNDQSIPPPKNTSKPLNFNQKRFIWGSYLDSCFRPSQYAGEGKIPRSKLKCHQISPLVLIAGLKRCVVDSVLRAFAMGKKNPHPEMTALSDPVQAALLKAAARKMRCLKEDKPGEKAGELHPIFTSRLGRVVEFQVIILPSPFWHNLGLDLT